jgi:hypothetical protein
MRTACPCCTDGKDNGEAPKRGSVLNQLCPKHGGPVDPRAEQKYELTKDGAVRKVKEA